ncbi:O-methyltransferase [Herbiconiux sp. SYSU D00978]|uniref:O-methyltransferase n=1 Tax=Herbiconiux sp. SYSU D00978 TaxID=2812562 RepID=UPI001A956381|nr:O-methyltransferase [Herbiconiux sp. SYSU D00978]
MSDIDASWSYSEQFVGEDEHIEQARQASQELGVEPVSNAVGSQLSVLAAASRARSIIEIGTGVGVSGLWMLKGAPDATLTSIDNELEHQQHARRMFTDAGIAVTRVRLITGDAKAVLPRMNESSYDIVFIDADPGCAIEYVEHGLRLARSGGLVLVAHAMWRGRVANPAARDEETATYRSLLSELAGSPAVLTALSPAGDGLLQIVKLGV